MTTFQERIKQTLERIDPNRDDPAVAPFVQVLNEFVETLLQEKPALGAAIEKGSHPQLRLFVTWPKYRRDERAIMLTFWWDGTTMKLVNESQRAAFTSPDELSDYLVDFLEESAFPETLAEYEARAKEGLDGYLRVSTSRALSAQDVIVEVTPEAQRTIATTTPGKDFTVEVTPRHASGLADYKDDVDYEYLVSGGFMVRILSHALEGAQIKITGNVVDEATN